MAERERAVVWLPSGARGWDLEAARPWQRPSVGGGTRSLYELAAALAAAGREVELRGLFSPPDLAEVCDAAGAWPELPEEPKAPTAADTVIISEGHYDPELHARLALSPTRVVLLLLGPPGLIGWPFTADWSPPDPLTVALDSVARPEHFRAAAALGYELWTHTPGLKRAAEAAGVECRFIGNGVPGGYPSPARARDIDVLWLSETRWAPIARRVVGRLSELGVACAELPTASHLEVLEHFGRARVVLHPLRIEGHSRIGCEARAMGAVPAVLRSNPFAVGLDADGGALAVETAHEMPEAIADLLASPQRLEQLSAAGMRTAREQVDWDAFVERVDAAYGSRAEHPGRAAHAEIGAALRARHDLMERELAARVAERDEAREDLERHRRWLDRTNESLSWRMTAPLRATKRRLARMPR